MPTDYFPEFTELKDLEKLRDGWDSHRGRAPAKAAMAAAKQALYAFRDRPPQVVPTANGGVQFEWRGGGVDLKLEIGADGQQELDEKQEALPAPTTGVYIDGPK